MSKGFNEYLKDRIKIESFGGTGGLITGSCHRVDINNSALLIDSGLYQGKFEERSKRGERRNFTPVKNIAKGVTDVLETHVHIDHTGRLPMIYRDGFTPRILTTSETAAFMEPMLYNSAKIQNEKNGDKLYSDWDVDNALRHIKIVKPFTLYEIGQKHSGITAEFLPNGHVAGSCSVLIRKHSEKTTILFTGDMGKEEQSLSGGYQDFMKNYPKEPIKTLVVESTNFEKRPVSFVDKKEKLLETIKKVWEGGGNPVLPVLSFHRAQEIMEIFHNAQKSGEIPEDCHFYIDAPLAVEVTDTFKKLGTKVLSRAYGEDKNFYKTEEESLARFDLKNSMIIDYHEASKTASHILSYSPSKFIIIASGGMGNYGRSVNYIHGDFAKNPKNAVILTCFQVEGTEGKKLMDEGKVTIKNEKKKKESDGAKVIKVEGFSSHISGPEDTFNFLNRFNLSKLENVIITHGKDSARKAMAEEFKRRGFGANIILSDINQVIEV